MNSRRLLIGVTLLLISGLGVALFLSKGRNDRSQQNETASMAEQMPMAHHASVPAYQSFEQAQKLRPTLAPSEFFGKAREAYQVARLIPQTLAQLPCYCHCDMAFGHKSLHTCFEDDHASQCAICVDEALLAYRLQKEGLTPDQVRAKIIEQYSTQ